MHELIHRTSPAKPRNPREGRKEQGPAPPPPWRNWLILVGLLFTLLTLFFPSTGAGKVTTLTYSQFLTKVTADDVRTASIDTNGAVTGRLTNNAEYRSQIPVALQDTRLAQVLQQHSVQITGVGPKSSSLVSVIVSLLPLLLFIGVFVYMGRRAQSQL